MIQKASEEVTKGGITFPILKTSYMEENTQKDEETCVSGPRQHSHAYGTCLCVTMHMMRCLTHASMHLAPRNSLTCVWRMALGVWRMFLADQYVVLWLFGAENPIF